MPLLAYCVAEAEPAVAPPSAGIRGHAVERRTDAGLACYYSVFAQPPSNLSKADALVFHKVITTIFTRTGVIPFRFPTLLEGEGELEVYLETEGHDLLEALQRLRGCAQMELRVTYGEHAAAPGAGKENLKSRLVEREVLEEVSDSVRDFLGEMVRGWHTREAANGLRCYALVGREDVAAFREKAQSLKTEGAVHLAVTGPWPPTEFLHDSNES